MKNKIEEHLPNHNIISTNAKNLYVVDYKNIDGGDVIMHDTEPPSISSVHIKNGLPIEICFDGFPENALPISTGTQASQCECVLFPNTCIEEDWILFIETKYANDLISAFKKENNYPKCMVDQIISTVQYFREKEIISKNRRVNAIVSFPNLIKEFNSVFFTGDISIEDILIEHKIKIRATNSALVKSNKRIVLNAI